MRWHRDVHFRVTVSSPGALPLHFRVLLLLDVPGDGDVVVGGGVECGVGWTCASSSGCSVGSGRLGVVVVNAA